MELDTSDFLNNKESVNSSIIEKDYQSDHFYHNAKEMENED